jgi:hypothetical protein
MSAGTPTTLIEKFLRFYQFLQANFLAVPLHNFSKSLFGTIQHLDASYGY